MKQLLATKDKIIVEATGSKEWGVGIPLEDEDCLDPDKWTGANQMGMILMQIREEAQRKTEQQESKQTSSEVSPNNSQAETSEEVHTFVPAMNNSLPQPIHNDVPVTRDENMVDPGVETEDSATTEEIAATEEATVTEEAATTEEATATEEEAATEEAANYAHLMNSTNTSLVVEDSEDSEGSIIFESDSSVIGNSQSSTVEL